MVNQPDTRTDASLLALRFPHKRNKDGVLPDSFIKLWNDLAFFSNNLQSKGRIRRAQKYIASFLGALEKCGAPTEQKLAQLTESACIYLNCCKTDRSFSADFLGAVQLQESRVNLKLVALVYGMGVTLMQKTGLGQEAALLSRALMAAFKRELPQLTALYEATATKKELSAQGAGGSA